MASQDCHDDYPLCLVARCKHGNVEQLVSEVTASDESFSYMLPHIAVPSMIWDFETKYYTCTVRLAKIEDRIISNTFLPLEGVILLFSPDKVDSWSDVKAWWSSLLPSEPEVRLLVCDSCEENSVVPCSEVQKWCIDNEFELVELTAPTDEDDLDVDGVKRIVQVLHAHMWPNLVMKDSPDTVSPFMKQLMNETRSEQTSTDDTEEDSMTANELGMDANELAKAMQDGGEEGVESFEKLFSQLQIMKEKAMNLPAEERKAYAEKVALSFWSAIGGSDDDSD